jgi:hypothetical protein
MGFLRKDKKEENLFLLFPDGREVRTKEDVDDLRASSAFTPSQMSEWVLQPSDIDSFAKAAAKLMEIGVPHNESIISVGPVTLLRFPKEFNEYSAEAILTVEHLVIFYQKRLLYPNFLVIPLRNAFGLTVTGPWSALFNFSYVTFIDKDKSSSIESTFFELRERMGKDGHENRRSIAVMDSLAKTLAELGNS